MGIGYGQTDCGLDALGWWAQQKQERWVCGMEPEGMASAVRGRGGGGEVGAGASERGCVKCGDFFLVSFSSDFNQEQMCEGADELETSVTTVRAEV